MGEGSALHAGETGATLGLRVRRRGGSDLHVCEVLREEPGAMRRCLHYALAGETVPFLAGEGALRAGVGRFRADGGHAGIRVHLHVRLHTADDGVGRDARALGSVLVRRPRLVRECTLPGGLNEASEEIAEEHKVLLAVDVRHVLRRRHVLVIIIGKNVHFEVVIEGDAAQLAVACLGLLLLHVPFEVGFLPGRIADASLFASVHVALQVVQLPLQIVVHSMHERTR